MMKVPGPRKLAYFTICAVVWLTIWSSLISLIFHQSTEHQNSECVPICFREHSEEHALLTVDDLTVHARIRSAIFDHEYVATTDRPLSNPGTECMVMRWEDTLYTDGVFGSAARDSLTVDYLNIMDAASSSKFIGPHSDQKVRAVLIISHGLGKLTFMQHSTFPDATITSIDLDPVMFEISNDWFCYHIPTEEKHRVRLLEYDGVRYIHDMASHPEQHSLDIIHIDVYEHSETVRFFVTPTFFLMLEDLWTRWNRIECRLRVLSFNEYVNSTELNDKPGFKTALAVFGKDRVDVHSNEVFTVVSSHCH